MAGHEQDWRRCSGETRRVSALNSEQGSEDDAGSSARGSIENATKPTYQMPTSNWTDSRGDRSVWRAKRRSQKVTREQLHHKIWFGAKEALFNAAAMPIQRAADRQETEAMQSIKEGIIIGTNSAPHRDDLGAGWRRERLEVGGG